MKGGVAIQLKLAHDLRATTKDVTYIFYDQEEVAANRNGLDRLARKHREWLIGDFAVLCEPSGGGIEAGCQGSMQLEVHVPGVAAHSARPWTGHNAIHTAGTVLATLQQYQPREVNIDGLLYRESLNAVGITGGRATNIIPDLCVIRLNYRFAPDRSTAEAEAHVRDIFSHYSVVLIDTQTASAPNLQNPTVARFIATAETKVTPKLGWTDVARFAELGIPAINFGPGDPLLAHKDNEHCPVSLITDCETALRRWLTTS
jgi:succinyl-diaminopimelate desuccinylase